jgi:hypothetical protein
MPNPSANNSSEQEEAWGRQLERDRQLHIRVDEKISDPLLLRRQNQQRQLQNSKLSTGLPLPGPGATAAASTTPKTTPNIGQPLPTLPMGKAATDSPGGRGSGGFEPQTPSSLETAKVAAQVASGVGLGKMAAEEMKDVAMAAGQGFFASLGATWQVINKYGPWLLFFAIYSLISEDPFITVPILLSVLWAWAIAAHWLKIKWLRTFNVLEQLALIVTSIIYMAAFVLIVLILALIACANDTTCATEAIRSLGSGGDGL